jgi:hypothetical protein
MGGAIILPALTAPLSLPVSIANGGTGQITAAAAYNALSPMTTKGDIEYESGTDTAARLAGNTTTQTEFLSSTGTGSAANNPSWATVPGQFLCPPVQYAPSMLANPAVTSLTYAAFDSTNINTGAFIAPASGKVYVTVTLTGIINSSTSVGFGLCAHGTVTPLLCPTNQFAPASAPNQTYTLDFLVGSLTAGTSYTFDLVGACSTSFTIYAQSLTTTTMTASNRGGPVLMTVQGV